MWQPLDSPYKRIAADANRTGSITTLDMIQIQQLILGEILEFEQYQLAFCEKDFVFLFLPTLVQPVPGSDQRQ